MALLLLGTAGVLKLLPATNAGAEGLFSACLRIGSISAVFWLAYPDLVRLPAWLFPAIVLVAAAMARWPWLLYFVPGMIVVGWLLRPRDVAGRSKAQRGAQARKVADQRRRIVLFLIVSSSTAPRSTAPSTIFCV